MMNDPGQMMNQAQMMGNQPPQIMAQPVQLGPNPVLVQTQSMNPPPPSQMMNPPPQQSQMMMSHSQAMNQPMMMMNQRGGYKKPWSQQSSMNQPNPFKFNNAVPSKPRSKSNNWKPKINNNNANLLAGPSGGYKPPSLNDLQTQNRMKARKYYHPKKKFNNRFAPYAPRNTTSFIIRAKKAGGIASLVSPCPVTPAVLPTPIFSPSREVLGDMAKEEWGVDGYGSMKGLIRLRSPGNEAEVVQDEDDDDEGNGSSDSDVEEHVEVERRLDHDLSRFEMIYPHYGGVGSGDYGYHNVLENRVDDQDTHIAQLEEENLTLKERLFLMERELGDLRRRLQFLERHQGRSSSSVVVEDVNEEVVENVSENDENESDGGSDVGATGVENNEDVMECVGGNEGSRKVSCDVKESNGNHIEGIVPNCKVLIPKDEVPLKDGVNNKKPVSEFLSNVEVTMADKVMDSEDECVATDAVMIKEDEAKGGEVGNEVPEKVISKDDEMMNLEDDGTRSQIEDRVDPKEDVSHVENVHA